MDRDQLVSAPLLGSPLLSTIIVVGSELTDPTLHVGLFVVVLKSIEPFALTIAWMTCPGTACDEPERLYYGTSMAAGPLTTLLAAPRPSWLQRGDAEAARRIIAAQVAAPKSQAAAPIDMLEITTSGARWVGPGVAVRAGAFAPRGR